MELEDNIVCSALQIAFEAGQAILEIYEGPFGFDLKPDNSPITIADRKAHEIIMQGLVATGLPLLSEEGIQTPYEIRKDWKQYWFVDPLDGTKEFISRNGDFTVNIALIEDHNPVFGVVYAPVRKMIYWGSIQGAFRMDVNDIHDAMEITEDLIKSKSQCLPIDGSNKQGSYTVLGSKSHMNAATEAFIQNLHAEYPELAFVSKGSSLKFCTLAEGNADIYPRFGPTMEWDTAAGHAVAVFSGCEVIQADSGVPLIYNKPDLLNPHFIAQRIKKEVTD